MCINFLQLKYRKQLSTKKLKIPKLYRTLRHLRSNFVAKVNFGVASPAGAQCTDKESQI